MINSLIIHTILAGTKKDVFLPEYTLSVMLKLQEANIIEIDGLCCTTGFLYHQ
ncbi:MAG: hypothetical protein H6Q26_2646 [Bacteroidetes bacterium]|nr:hypothetical protein [Bacteroidota bacterium]